MKKLTDNLELIDIDEYSTDENEKLVRVYLGFRMFGMNCEAIIEMKNVRNDNPSYLHTESPTDIHSSFNDLIEDEEHFEKIKQSILDFEKAHDKEMEQYL